MGARVLLVVLVLLALGTGDARAAAAPRADLRVPSGRVSAGDGALRGSVVVANGGRRRAARTSATLVLRGGGRRQVAGRFGVGRLARGARRTVRVQLAVPAGLPPGRYAVLVCADARGRVRERSERNNCRRVGRLVVAVPAPPAGSPSTVPSAPVPYEAGTTFKLGDYWMDVPAVYDASHRTPAQLLVWSHGCGGRSADDVGDVRATDGRGYLTIALDGREDGCWDMEADPSRVLAAIADVETHFNVDRRRIVLGGYSSGGDLSYRTAFYNSRLVSGLIVENTSPFRDTGSTKEASLAAATVKFPVVHLAHTEDDTYGIDGVREETDALKDAGFPVTRIERPGAHYDDNTTPDLKALGLPHMDDGWLAPGA